MKGGIRDGKVQIIEMYSNFLSELNSYFEGKSILCVQYLSDDKVLVCINDDFNMKVLDLRTNEIK
jgi:phospholipid N-methyltransferase